MIKSILLATDGSDYARAAWHYATDIARAYGAQLRVISVADIRVRQVIGDGFEDELGQLGVRAELLDEVRHKTETLGLKVQVSLEQGLPWEAIRAQESTVDLVAIGHRGRRGLLERLRTLGSVAEQVVRHSTRPVLVAPQEYTAIGNTLVAYDGSEPAQHALHWAANLTTTLATGLVVVHVNQNREQGQTALREAHDYLKPYGIQEKAILTSGDPVAGILETARETGAGLIVMGAHGRSGLPAAFLGGVTEAMLGQMDRPLLMTR